MSLKASFTLHLILFSLTDALFEVIQKVLFHMSSMLHHLDKFSCSTTREKLCKTQQQPQYQQIQDILIFHI